MAMNVINQPKNVVAKFNAIAKIHKYRRIHERHHFISMAMEVHGALWHDVNHFIKECACLFHNRESKEIIYFCFLKFNFLKNILILFFSMFNLYIERKISWKKMFVLCLLLLLDVTICMTHLL